jgi:GAF domain-containing protein
MDDCAELQNALLATATIEEFLRELPRIAVRRVAEGASCGMTILPEGRPAAVAATDQVAANADELQYRLDDGPCPQAMRDGEAVTIQDTAWNQRWPEFEAQAAAAGIRSCLAVPMQAVPMQAGPMWAGPMRAGHPQAETPAPRRSAIGVISLYARDTAAFGEEQTRRAEQFAENASIALAIAERLVSYVGLNEQLRASLATRPVIDQAIGIIIARENCSQSAAFGTLRKASQNSNTKLRDLAARIVTEVTGEPVQPPPFVMPGEDPSAARTLG